MASKTWEEIILKNKSMNTVVTGCEDCPLWNWDREEGSRCEHPIMQDKPFDDKEIKVDIIEGEVLAITPDWCPLKKESITIELKQ